jgi:O-Antigen ligase
MGRSLARVNIAMFTALVFLLIQSVFWSPIVSVGISSAVAVLIGIAYFRPHNALLVLAALAPLSGVWSPLVSDRIRGAEAFVLAFLAGALLRGWTLHSFKNIALDRLRIAAFVFGVVVAVSCALQLGARDAAPRDVLGYVGVRYLASTGGYGMIFSAMLLIEGLALLVYTVHYCRIQPGFAWRLVRMLVIGGASAAVVNVWFFVHELIESGQPVAHFSDFLLNRRWSAHIGDVNAAGSFFAMIMFIALGLALKHRSDRVGWLCAGFFTGVALWMTASRAALIAAALVAVVSIVRMLGPRSIIVKTAVIASLLVGLGLATWYFSSRPMSADASVALMIRREFLATTGRMIKANPVLGVGIGQYARVSSHYSSPALLAYYPRENAHNYFAQVAGELGLAGLAAFLAVLLICLWPPHEGASRSPIVAPVLAGIAAFIVSWLGGHPLLVPEVAYPFWLALAVLAGTRLP